LVRVHVAPVVPVTHDARQPPALAIRKVRVDRTMLACSGRGRRETMEQLRTDIAVIGGGLGGCAAALAAAALGKTVVMTEEARWVGGQLTSEAVPLDEHPWIESFGATAAYRALRHAIRRHYREHTPLTSRARHDRRLNPGNGWVSRLCVDPRIAAATLDQMMLPYELNGRVRILREHRATSASSDGDRVTGVTVERTLDGHARSIEATFFIDATAWGDLWELGGVEHASGPEARSETGEPHAAEHPDAHDEQAVTVVFALDHLEGEDHRIPKPEQYERWRAVRPPSWPGRLLDWTVSRPETHEPLTRRLFDGDDGKSLWEFRRILDRTNFEDGFARSDITLVNWPQNDYRFGPLLTAGNALRERHLHDARQLSLSLLYWLQNEAPRRDGGVGFPGLRLRSDVMGGTADGLAPAPYVRSARRLRAELTVLEQHIGHPLRPNGAERFDDSVGVGCYRIDLHPTLAGEPYLDIGCWPFQSPLGALIPIRVDNVLPGGKNLGVTHITNGAFRVHHVEWNVGESAGILAAFCLERRVTPRAVRSSNALLGEYQALLRRQGVELAWPTVTPM
jgi:hypothetical protein